MSRLLCWRLIVGFATRAASRTCTRCRRQSYRPATVTRKETLQAVEPHMSAWDGQCRQSWHHPLHWLATSQYEYMWLLEDDVWSRDFGAFSCKFENSTADLIARSSSSDLPFWYQDNWNVGAQRHGLPKGKTCCPNRPACEPCPSHELIALAPQVSSTSYSALRFE